MFPQRSTRMTTQTETTSPDSEGLRYGCPCSCHPTLALEARRFRQTGRMKGNAEVITVEIRWDENAGLRRDAISSQVIDALEAQGDKETGNEED